MADNPLRDLPSVNDVLDAEAARPLCEQHGREQVVAAVRAELDDVRQAVRAGQPLDGRGDLASVVAAVGARLSASLRPKLVHVINATGIVLHTNLGRAPVAAEAARAAG